MCSPLSVPLALVVLLWDTLFSLNVFSVSLSLFFIFLSLSIFNLSLSLWLHSLSLSFSLIMESHSLSLLASHASHFPSHFSTLVSHFFCVYVLICFSSLFVPLCHFLFTLYLSCIFCVFLIFPLYLSSRALHCSLVHHSPYYCFQVSGRLFPRLSVSLPPPPPPRSKQKQNTQKSYMIKLSLTCFGNSQSNLTITIEMLQPSQTETRRSTCEFCSNTKRLRNNDNGQCERVITRFAIHSDSNPKT